MSRIRIIIAVLLAGALGAGIFAYKMYNKPHRDIAAAKADYTLSADELFDAFESDEATANSKYLDKVIVVDGTIESATNDNDNNTVLTLTASNALAGGIMATLDKSGGPSGLHDPGTTITLKCRCTGMLLDVVLTDCSIVSK